MFGYVRPAADRLTQEQTDLFRSAYCGLCRTLGRRYGLPARMILNYDLAFLAILLAGGSGFSCARHRCPVHPIRGCPCGEENPALDAAADLSVILTWWQLRDGVTDHGFFGGLKYRLAALLLRRSYRKAARLRPDFDRLVQGCLGELTALEQENCPSIDRPADTFARLLAQLLYHLGRWIYLTDAADDLAKDQRSGSYNPLPLRFSVQEGKLTEESRQELAQTMDRSVERMAAAFELLECGVWQPVIESVVYAGLYQVGNAVLNGTFHQRPRREKYPERKAGHGDA